MSAKHTPGPWTIENCKNDDGSKFLSINGQGPWGSWLADIQAGNINGKPADVGPRHLANARLIASAPDLLAALVNMVEQFGHYCEHTEDAKEIQALVTARAAIAKVEGVK
jgi:hypothetical protein